MIIKEYTGFLDQKKAESKKQDKSVKKPNAKTTAKKSDKK